MSLEKIPLIILHTFTFQALMKPPNRLPPKEELVPSIMFDANVWMVLLVNAIFATESISALAEILSIVAHANPQWKISGPIISTLVKTGGDAGALGVTPLGLLGIILVLSGTIWRRWAFHEMGRFFVYRLSLQKNHKLITTGPYSVVRHPGYSGMIVGYIGWFCWVGSSGSWLWQSRVWNSPVGVAMFVSYAGGALMGSAIFACIRMGREDNVMRKEFGKQWDDWARVVPYAIIPWVY